MIASINPQTYSGETVGSVWDKVTTNGLALCIYNDNGTGFPATPPLLVNQCVCPQWGSKCVLTKSWNNDTLGTYTISVILAASLLLTPGIYWVLPFLYFTGGRVNWYYTRNVTGYPHVEDNFSYGKSFKHVQGDMAFKLLGTKAGGANFNWDI